MGLKLIILGTASITLRNIIGFKLGLELFMTPWSVALLLPPLDGMLVHHKVTPPPQHYVAGTHLYTWVERDKLSKVSCLRKEHDGRDQRPGLNNRPSG